MELAVASMTVTFLVVLLCFSQDRDSFSTLGKLFLTLTFTLLSFVVDRPFPYALQNLNHPYVLILVFHVGFMDFGEGVGA
jgi:hypothetical protein